MALKKNQTKIAKIFLSNRLSKTLMTILLNNLSYNSLKKNKICSIKGEETYLFDQEAPKNLYLFICM